MEPDWSDIRIFLAASLSGSFARAARRTGLSPATVGRRIEALEAALGLTLFERMPDGHRLTEAGHTLLPAAGRMAAAIGDFSRDAATRRAETLPVLRISAEEWEALLLARHLDRLRRTLATTVSVELSMAHRAPSLGRRETDILMLAELPRSGDLVARKLGVMGFAAYGASTYVEAAPEALTEARYRHCQWVGFNADHAYFPSARWLLDQRDGTEPEQRCGNALLILEATRAGSGLALLPLWLGDADAGLRRVSSHLPALDREIWWLTHPDLQENTGFRALTDAVAALLRTVLGPAGSLT